MQSRNTPYLERLDHMRFYAATIILLFHVGLWVKDVPHSLDMIAIPLIDQGHTAVQLFMVISGMILAIITYEKDIDPLKFYWNRTLRIYPLFLLVVSLGYFSTPDPRPTSTGLDFLMAMLPISNLYRLQFGPFGGHLWSIPVELQFYLLFPLLLILLRRFGTAYYVGLIGFMLLIRGMLFYLNQTVHQLSFFTLFGALDVFMIGNLAGIAYKEKKVRLNSPYWTMLTFIAANLIIWFLFSHAAFFHFDYNGVTNDGISHHWLWVVWPTIQGVMWAIVLLAYLQSNIRIFGSTLLAKLGRYSYSMYVWHTLIILLVLKTPLTALTPYLLGVLVVLPITVIFSALSYHLVEAPFLSMRVIYGCPRRIEAGAADTVSDAHLPLALKREEAHQTP
jgi:peptidoglycan/LPS O-acetylase OafA/YrhL